MNGEGPVFEIPQPLQYRLAQSPLVQVLVQVRFPLVAHFQELTGVADIQDSLLDLLPYMERQQVQQLAVALGPAGIDIAPPAEPTVVWRFTADDQWACMLEPGSSALMVGGDDYHGIDDFAQRFKRVLEALHRTRRIRRCDRIGVRYVNVIEPPGGGRSWVRWFRSEMIGWMGSAIVGNDTQLQMSLTQSQLAAKPTGPFAGFPADVQALIRHGVLPLGTEIPFDIGITRQLDQEAYVLDLDLFIQAPQRFDLPELMKQFTALHTQIDAFFRWSLTPEGEKHFGLEEL